MIRKYLLLGLLLIVFGACTDQEEEGNGPETEEVELVFGHFFGECNGEGCIEIYMLDDDGLYEDVNDTYPGSNDFYEASWVKLPDSTFEKVKDLVNLVPQELIENSTRVFGQPDAGDWGGYYFEYEENDIHNFWLIDNANGNLPEQYLIDFKTELAAAIERINE